MATTPMIQVLMITTEWPTPERPYDVPFLVRNVDYLRRAGVKVDVFHFRGARRLLNYVTAWKAVRRKLKSGRYDLVHCQFGQSALVALPKVLPLIITFRGDDLEGIIGRRGRYTIVGKALQLISFIVARLADEVIVVSQRLAAKLPPRSYHVIASGIDLEVFRPIPVEEARRQLNLPTNRRLILFVGSTDPVKRYWLAQAAVSQLGALSNTDLVVVDGAPHNAMPLYMSACDVLLLTSLHEGSPNVVKEALACNLPVIATDVGDVRERLEGLQGCAIVQDSPEEICKALKRILQNPRRIDSRGCVSSLDERVLTNRLISIYQQVLIAAKRTA
jgi:glycosyltransferase involved in cell wall biosynthesis